jgi:ribosomal protein L23
MQVLALKDHGPQQDLLCVHCRTPVQITKDENLVLSLVHSTPEIECLGHAKEISPMYVDCAAHTLNSAWDTLNEAWKNEFLQILSKAKLENAKLEPNALHRLSLQSDESGFVLINCTKARLFHYHLFKHDGNDVFFCTDVGNELFHNRHIFCHCSDNVIREVCCGSVVQIQPEEGSALRVVILRNIPVDSAYFEVIRGLETSWEQSDTCQKVMPAATEAVLMRNPIKVLSVAGRLTVDHMHRSRFSEFPAQKMTIYNAPPGAGKTTAIKEAVRIWRNKKVLIIVYNKANQENLRQEIKECLHCTVKTLDALCMAATRKKFSNDSESDDFDEDASDKTFLKRHFPKWNLSDKLRYGGGATSSKIISHRLTHPKAECVICKKHKRLSMVTSRESDRHGWDASFTSFPIHTIVKNVTTFASRRYICDRDNKLKAVFEKYDIVLIDEMQDLFSAQEMRLIMQAECPIVMVGDFDQTINDFRHSVPQHMCDQRDKCFLPSENIPKNQCSVIEWYSTFRLDALTVLWLEDMTGKRMHSMRPADQKCVITWSLNIPHLQKTLIICRKNESVITEAIKYADIAGVHVIGGVRIAGLLRQAAKDSSSKAGMPHLAARLKANNTFDKVVEMLDSSDISLKLLSGTSVLAIGTVHQLKGFEYDHVAVHEDVIEAAMKERVSTSVQGECTEQNCFFVAISRHRLSLTILCDLKVAQTIIDIPASSYTQHEIFNLPSVNNFFK